MELSKEAKEKLKKAHVARAQKAGQKSNARKPKTKRPAPDINKAAADSKVFKNTQVQKARPVEAWRLHLSRLGI